MNKSLLNEMTCTFTAVSENESFARTIAASFISQASPTVSQLADVKCAVSEAVTKAVAPKILIIFTLIHPLIHAHCAEVKMTISRFDDNSVIITISDKGIGIPDVEAARAPLYTTDTTGERSGMGFAIMEGLMDACRVRSKVGFGTVVTMKIRLGAVVCKSST